MKRKHVWMGLVWLAGGCEPSGSFEASDLVEADSTPPARIDGMPAAQPLGAESRTGSTLQLARLGSRRVALIADEDAHAVRIVDPESLEEIGARRLDGTPSQLAVAGDGRAYVALRDRAEVVALEVTSDAAGGVELGEAGRLAVATEPVALATTPDGSTLLVSSAWGAKLTGFHVGARQPAFEVALAREPRGVTVGKDGRVAHVAHAVGSRVSRVDLETGDVTEVSFRGRDFTPAPTPSEMCEAMEEHRGRGFSISDPGCQSGVFRRDAVQGFAIASLHDKVHVPNVLVHRGHAFSRADRYGGGDFVASYPPHQPSLASFDASGGTLLRVARQATPTTRSFMHHNGGDRTDACFLPRSAASDEENDTLLVGCYGSNTIEAYTGSGDDLDTSMKARWRVWSAPSGIAVDGASRRALVWSQWDRALMVLRLPEGDAGGSSLPEVQPPVRVAQLGQLRGEPEQLSERAARGRELFHAVGDGRISEDGRACASCHVDGREDGLEWSTPDGARQTPMLAGRLDDGTAPYGWHGDRISLGGHIQQTYRRLGGTGLPDDDHVALITYCREMSVPDGLRQKVAEGDVAHGKELFFAAEVGCASCHREGGGSDGGVHDVGSGASLETPSLRFVSGTGPYFHDGRFATLAELLSATKGQMGFAAAMGDQDLRALEAYLLTL